MRIARTTIKRQNCKVDAVLSPEVLCPCQIIRDDGVTDKSPPPYGQLGIIRNLLELVVPFLSYSRHRAWKQKSDSSVNVASNIERSIVTHDNPVDAALRIMQQLPWFDFWYHCLPTVRTLGACVKEQSFCFKWFLTRNPISWNNSRKISFDNWRWIIRMSNWR